MTGLKTLDDTLKPEPDYMRYFQALIDSQLFAVAIGALLGFVATLLTTRFQLRWATEMKTKELIAEKRMLLLPEAYKRMRELGAKVFQGGTVSMKGAVDELSRQQDWFIENQMFLPVAFANTWLQIAKRIIQFNVLNMAKPPDLIRLEKLYDEIMPLVKEAIRIIYETFGREPMEGEIETERSA